MRIVVSASVIPERHGTFSRVRAALLREQRRPIDEFVVYLARAVAKPEGCFEDRRVRWVTDQLEAGPWARYLTAETLADDDVIVTVDDDTDHPPDYVQVGVESLLALGSGAAVSFGGILWDPLSEPLGYVENSWRYLPYRGLSTTRRVAILMGIGSFMRAAHVKGALAFPLPGYHTNDDMMISDALQRRGVAVWCLPKAEGWVRELETSQAPHALAQRDRRTRHATFAAMCTERGFDPTAGELSRFLQNRRRVLVEAEAPPQKAGMEHLDSMLRELAEGKDVSVHVIAPVPACDLGATIIATTVMVPEPGGRLDWLPPIRTGRTTRVSRERARRWEHRRALARARLRPTAVDRYSAGTLIHLEGAA